jgi:hypothetical protein
MLRCERIDMSGPLLQVARKPGKGPSRQDLLLPYHAVAAIFRADRNDPAPFGFHAK